MAANNSVRVTLKVRNDTAAHWTSNNPTLAAGEWGLENDTSLLKIGNGTTPWNSLPYLNKFDSSYFTIGADGEISVDQTYAETLITTDGGVIDGTLTITNPPVNDTDAANKTYVDTQIANAGHLKREIVTTLPTAANADPDTIYMVKDTTAAGDDKYKEYMKIGNALEQIGDTSVDLNGLVTGTVTTGNLIMTDANGALVDSGILAADIGKLEPGTSSVLGGVKSSTADDFIRITSASDSVGAGFMTLNGVSTTKLYVPSGDTLILDGGSSSGG